jgi:L-threonylcarbamoyladenylate synthase
LIRGLTFGKNVFMITETLSTDHPEALSRALEILQNHGLVAFPTDTVYGLAAATFSTAAIEMLYEAKSREAVKAIAVLVGDLDQLSLLTSGLTDSARRLAERFWPGALTLVVPKHAMLPENLSVYPTVGVRMPNHPFALALLRKVGPLATTSANLSGGANASTPEEVLAQLNGRFHLLLDGGTCPGGVPSTVVDCTQTPPVILRQGAVSAQDILNT